MCKEIRVRCRQTLMAYIQKDNIYTSIQEMLKCEIHLNNIEKTESVFGVGGVGGVAKLIVQTSFVERQR